MFRSTPPTSPPGSRSSSRTTRAASTTSPPDADGVPRAGSRPSAVPDLGGNARIRHGSPKRSQIGPPAQQASAGSTEVWSYPSGGETISSATATGTTYGTSATVVGTGVTQNRYCVVNVSFSNG